MSDTVLNNDVDFSSLSDSKAYFYYPPGNTISQQDNCFAFDSSDGTKIYIDNLAMTGSDYMPSYYRFDYRTAGWPATSSFNTTVFDNKAYVVPSDYPNPAQSIINKLTNFNFSYPPFWNTFINTTSAQSILLTQLDAVNKDVLKSYLSDAGTMINYKFTLDSGSDCLVYGNNPATFTITYPNYPQWTAQVDLNILESSKGAVIASKLANAILSNYFCIYFVDAQNSWKKVPIQKAINNRYLFNGGYGQVTSQGIWDVCPQFKNICLCNDIAWSDFTVEPSWLTFQASGQLIYNVKLIYKNFTQIPIILKTVSWRKTAGPLL